MKTKVQAFADILDATVESVSVNGENVEVTQTFTYLGSVIHSSTNCELYRGQSTTGTSLEHDEFAGRSCVTLPILVLIDEGPSLSLAGPSCLAVFL